MITRFVPFRFLYIFIWKNVGHLNDDFFGFFLILALANVTLTLYYGLLSVAAPGI